MTIAYVLLSGGIDSTTCLGRAVSYLDREHVYAVSVDYGQRHRRELRSASEVANHYGVSHEILRVDTIPRTMLTDISVEVPSIAYSEITGVSPTYVPFRNGLLLSTLAAHVAGQHLDPLRRDQLHFNEDVDLYFGAHAEDAAGGAYPDCSVEFVTAMGEAIRHGTYNKVRLVAPFIHAFKTEIITVGTALKVPYQLTWSCYRGGELHCGSCSTCIARREAFATARVLDPTAYAEK